MHLSSAIFYYFVNGAASSWSLNFRTIELPARQGEGDAAGRLIQEAGCKMLRRNGVTVSEKHANYFVNDDTGTAADFLALMDDVRGRVAAEFGVELHAEVKFWGFDDR